MAWSGPSRRRPGSVAYTANGNTIVLMFVDGKDFADFGNGLAPATADQGTREDTDPLALSALYAPFAAQADDFILAGKETAHGVVRATTWCSTRTSSRRCATSSATATRPGSRSCGWPRPTAVSVKAVWGGPPGARHRKSFAPPFYTIDVTDTNCTCPGDRAGLTAGP